VLDTFLPKIMDPTTTKLVSYGNSHICLRLCKGETIWGTWFKRHCSCPGVCSG